MTADDEPGRHFPFRYESRLAPIWLPFRLWPGAQGVTVTEDGRLIARYGPLRVDTPLSQIQGAVRSVTHAQPLDCHIYILKYLTMSTMK